MTKTLEFENAEEIGSNDIHGGTFSFTLFNQDATIIAEVEIEHEFDDGDLLTTASVKRFTQLDANDRLMVKTFTDEEIESFIERNRKVGEFFQDIVEGYAE